MTCRPFKRGGFGRLLRNNRCGRRGSRGSFFGAGALRCGTSSCLPNRGGACGAGGGAFSIAGGISVGGCGTQPCGQQLAGGGCGQQFTGGGCGVGQFVPQFAGGGCGQQFAGGGCGMGQFVPQFAGGGCGPQFAGGGGCGMQQCAPQQCGPQQPNVQVIYMNGGGCQPQQQCMPQQCAEMVDCCQDVCCDESPFDGACCAEADCCAEACC